MVWKLLNFSSSHTAGAGFGSAKTSKAKIILEGDELLGGGVATYCFDTEATRDRFVLALENLAQGREWHEDATSSSRGRLGLSGGSGSTSGGGGGGGGGVGVICALPMGQVMADYCELLDVYKAFVSGKILYTHRASESPYSMWFEILAHRHAKWTGATARAETITRLKSEHSCFAEFLQNASATAGGHSLDSLIVNPVQRIPRYVMLVSLSLYGGGKA